MRTASSKAFIIKGLLSLGLLAVLAFALSSVAFSGASFTSVSQNPINQVAAGSLLHVNDQDGRLMIDAGGLVPDTSRAGTLTLTATGSLTGQYSLSASGLTDTPSSPRLSDALTLTIEDLTTSTTLYEGSVSGFSSKDLGAIAPGGARSIRVTLTYPPGTNDAALQGATMTLGLRVTGVTS
jgi:hypothetical protein